MVLTMQKMRCVHISVELMMLEELLLLLPLETGLNTSIPCLSCDFAGC